MSAQNSSGTSRRLHHHAEQDFPEVRCNKLVGRDSAFDAQTNQHSAVDRHKALPHPKANCLLRDLLTIVGSRRINPFGQCGLTTRDADWIPKIAAGWHLCLLVAERLLQGHPIKPIIGETA